ncbi:MAG TPA: thioredoxin family protein [Terriglobales bacterium]|nr:thioredoxin family protein [Terriglobales bacterium]
MATAIVQKSGANVVSHAEWLAARKQFLAKEKELTHLRDELSRQRRELPWEKVEKRYTFDGPNGKLALDELFGESSQLIVYHLMFGPGWKEACPSCSMISDQFDSIRVHMLQRDTNLIAVSRATFPEIEAFKKRMGWKFPWVSSFGSDFNSDYNVSFALHDAENGKIVYNYETATFPAEEAPGVSVFHRKDGEVFHTYSSFGRGLDIMLNVYNFLDLTPKGRNEEGLPWPMAWVRHHDKYGDPKAFDAMMLFAQAKDNCCSKK